MEKKSTNRDALFFLGKTNEEELLHNFDRIYDGYKLIAKKKGLYGDIKFVESLEDIFIYVKIV